MAFSEVSSSVLGQERVDLYQFPQMATQLNKTLAFIQGIANEKLLPPHEKDLIGKGGYKLWTEHLAVQDKYPLTEEIHRVFATNVRLAKKVFEGFGTPYQIGLHVFALLSGLSAIPPFTSNLYASLLLYIVGSLGLNFELMEMAGRRQHFFGEAARNVRDHSTLMRYRFDRVAIELVCDTLKLYGTEPSSRVFQDAKNIQKNMTQLKQMISAFSLQKCTEETLTRCLEAAVEWVIDVGQGQGQEPRSKQPCRDRFLRAVIRESTNKTIKKMTCSDPSYRYETQRFDYSAEEEIPSQSVPAQQLFPKNSLWYAKKLEEKHFLKLSTSVQNAGIAMLSMLCLGDDYVPFSLEHARIFMEARKSTAKTDFWLSTPIFLSIIIPLSILGALGPVIGPASESLGKTLGAFALVYASSILAAYYSRFSTGINPMIASMTENDAIQAAEDDKRNYWDGAAMALIEIFYEVDDAFNPNEKATIAKLLGNFNETTHMKKVQKLAEIIAAKLDKLKPELSKVLDINGTHIEMTLGLEEALKAVSSSATNTSEFTTKIEQCHLRKILSQPERCSLVATHSPSVEQTASSVQTAVEIPSNPSQELLEQPQASRFCRIFEWLREQWMLQGTGLEAHNVYGKLQLLPDTKGLLSDELITDLIINYSDRHNHVPFSKKQLMICSAANTMNAVTYLFLGPLGFMVLGSTLLASLAIPSMVTGYDPDLATKLTVLFSSVFGALAGIEGIFFTGKNSAFAGKFINQLSAQADISQHLFEKAAYHLERKFTENRTSLQPGIDKKIIGKTLALYGELFAIDPTFKLFGRRVLVSNMTHTAREVTIDILKKSWQEPLEENEVTEAQTDSPLLTPNEAAGTGIRARAVNYSP